MDAETTDVVICGAGPVGLVIALGLAQQGVKTLIIGEKSLYQCFWALVVVSLIGKISEQRERQAQQSFGRACTLYPRTLELLEQVGVAEEIVQAAFTGKSYAVYKDGKKQIRQTWQAMLPYMESSFHGYITNIRQQKSEDILASQYQANFGREVYYGWELQGQEVDTAPADGHNVTVSLSHALQGRKQIRW